MSAIKHQFFGMMIEIGTLKPTQRYSLVLFDRTFHLAVNQEHRSLVGQKMIVLCTYSLQASRAVDMLDVARAHQCTITRRNGDRESSETPERTQIV